MPSTDDRIVRMEFDNTAFQRKLDETITSLGHLEKALKFDGAKQGLQGLSTEVGKFDMGKMGTVVEGVSTKFLALSTIAVTALATITSKAITTGVQLAKSLSLDQIISGFKEYELNMQSIQTILANTKADGTNLGQVNAALDELNHYADKTIYNFGQMTKNIGTFTAAGVDLNTSVQSIKGISNLAAISGSSAEQASTAMYQLSQAVSTGTLKLMDWNSVVNAGMGGEVFQKALFETGKAMHTIKDVPMGQTFEQWTKAGNSFRDSLKDGWVTSEVLTNTLKGFTGEMTDAQLAAMGYSKAQIAQIQELGRTGVDAATKVRTLTQLIDTTKEAIGSGWSESFRIVIGNFEEATTLFTDISNAIGKMVGENADARNAMLQGWKNLGGRTLLLESLRLALKNIADIIKPIKEAWRDVFPAVNAITLMNMTKAFRSFIVMLVPSQQTIENVKRIFTGLFSALEIGWTIIKEGVKFIKDLVSSVSDVGSGKFLEFFAGIGDALTALNDKLVSGGGIKDFFVNLKQWLQDPIPYLIDLKNKIIDFFTNLSVDGISGLDGVGGAFGRVTSRFEHFKETIQKIKDIWKPFGEALAKVGDFLERCWQAIRDWFKELGNKIAAVMQPGDFDAVLDALNVGLLGGIAALLAKFIKDGFTFDIGSGFFEKIGKSFEQLTGVLKAMQTDIRADALLKIAAAIGILTASVLVLSLIDSAALTKSLTAMAVGFGQLMGAFVLINKIGTDAKSTAQFAAVSAGMILLASAIGVMAVAVKILANLSWDDLARGLTGVTVLLGIMTTSVKLLSGESAKMILVGAGLMAIAVAINILAGAVAIFATMSWGEMVKGFAGVGAGLLIIAGAMQLMPISMVLTGIGLLAVAVSLNILAGALKIFATMSWGDMAKGMAGIAGGLVIIALAMQLMPLSLPITAAGLVLVSFALGLIAGAMKIMGSMSWAEIGRGLTVMAASLLLLAVAAFAMTESIPGAIAIGIMSASLLLLVQVLKAMAGISWGDLIHGLVGIAAVIAVLAVAALLIQPALPAMFGLGAALLVIGAGFALFGVGANMVAKAFESLAKMGKAGSEALVVALENIGKALPALAKGFAEGILDLLAILVKASPVIVKGLVEILQHLLEGLTKLLPEVGKVIGTAITEVINIIKTKYPELIIAGIEMILAILTGIRDNIGGIVTVVGEIIVEFVNALDNEIPRIIDSVANFIIDVFNGAAEAAGRVAATMMYGVAIKFIEGFMQGLADELPGPAKWFTDLAGKVLGWIGNVIKTLWGKGTDFITGLLGGITGKATEVITWFMGLAGKILGWIGNTLTTLKDKGWDLIQGFWTGVTDRFNAMKDWIGGILNTLKNAIPNPLNLLYDIGKKVIDGLWNGMKDMWDNVTGWLGNLNPANWFNDINLKKGHAEKNLIPTGKVVMEGLHSGMKDEWDVVSLWLSTLNPANELDPKISAGMSKIVNDVALQLDSMEEFSPTITPVLDLTNFMRDAKKIDDYMPSPNGLNPSYSYAQASTIASTATANEDAIKAPAGSGEVKFEQNIYSPTQLSTSDIYRQTRNQITLAKQELSIP